MNENAIMEKIETLTEQRRRLRGVDPGKCDLLTDEIDTLYGKLRTERARLEHGDRADILKRARIERELEKLTAQ